MGTLLACGYVTDNIDRLTTLIHWMAADYGFDQLDAYQLLSQAGGLSVGNMVDTNYSLVAKCPKRYLTRPA